MLVQLVSLSLLARVISAYISRSEHLNKKGVVLLGRAFFIAHYLLCFYFLYTWLYVRGLLNLIVILPILIVQWLDCGGG